MINTKQSLDQTLVRRELNKTDMPKYTSKVNTYETQAILYWILGVLILNIGEYKMLGWASIIYGWVTFSSVIIIGILNRKEINKEWE